MVLPKPILFAAAVLAMASTGLSEGKRLADFLDLPPLFERHFGNPKVVVLEGRKGKSVSFGVNPSPRRVLVRARDGMGVQEQLVDAVLARAWDDFLKPSSRSFEEKRMKMHEIIPMTKQEFLTIGRARLRGKSAASAIGDAWWKVRTDMPLRRSGSYQFLFANLHSDLPKQTAGHFCFGFRQIGGNAGGDTLFDFRAPWVLDRSPTLVEGMNFNSTLKIQVMSKNLYDWLYTQTEYRGCYVNLWFLPVSVEQVTLMKYFLRHQENQDAGNFRGLQKNCASLGLVFYNRLVPFDEELPVSDIADLPIKTAKKVMDTFPEEPAFYKLDNVTDDRGREITARSKVHRAQPSRAGSRAFRELRTVPGIN